MARTIVMIHPGGLGDGLLAVSAITRLRARFPQHWLVLLAEDQVAKLLCTCGLVDAWSSMQGRACTDLLAGAGSSMDQLTRWVENCDLAIGWMKDTDSTLSETLKTLGVRKVIVRSPFSTAIQAVHQCDRFLETFNEAPSDGKEDAQLMVTEPLLQLGRTYLEAADLSAGQSLVVIHPGSGSAHKCVAPDIMAALIIALQNAGAIPAVLEGPADREPVERLLQVCMHPPIVLKGLDILAVAGVLAQAQLFVGHDSGVTHLAGLIGIPTVALFGPTDPDRWAPRGTNVTVVQGTPCLCRSWDDVRRCENKSCLAMPQDPLVALCLAHLKAQ
jgi:heptosyltransferase III